ncbi:FAM83 domain-containing protein, partial [Podarcis lilfordi]
VHSWLKDEGLVKKELLILLSPHINSFTTFQKLRKKDGLDPLLRVRFSGAAENNLSPSSMINMPSSLSRPVVTDSGVAVLISLYWPREPAYGFQSGAGTEERELTPSRGFKAPTFRSAKLITHLFSAARNIITWPTPTSLTTKGRQANSKEPAQATLTQTPTYINPDEIALCLAETCAKLGVSSLEKRRFRKDMIAIFKYLRGCHMEDGASLFCPVLRGRTQTNGFKVHERRFKLNIRKNLLTVCGLSLLGGGSREGFTNLKLKTPRRRGWDVGARGSPGPTQPTAPGREGFRASTQPGYQSQVGLRFAPACPCLEKLGRPANPAPRCWDAWDTQWLVQAGSWWHSGRGSCVAAPGSRPLKITRFGLPSPGPTPHATAHVHTHVLSTVSDPTLSPALPGNTAGKLYLRAAALPPETKDPRSRANQTVLSCSLASKISCLRQPSYSDDQEPA